MSKFMPLLAAAERGELAFPAQLAPHLSCRDLGLAVMMTFEAGKHIRARLKALEQTKQDSPALRHELLTCSQTLDAAQVVWEEWQTAKGLRELRIEFEARLEREAV